MPGVTTEELDRLCHDYIVERAEGDPGERRITAAFPKTICTSVNHVVCHGIPNDKVLKAGDIVNIDVTVIKDGFHGDTSRMYYVGKPPLHAQRLTETCCEAMWRGIEQVRPGARLGDIGHAIQTLRRGARTSPWCASTAATASAASITRTRRCCTTASRAPASSCKAGMTFTIEPMVNAGKRHVRLLPDGWTVVTKDHSLSAQWEHTVLVTPDRLRSADARRAAGPPSKLDGVPRRGHRSGRDHASCAARPGCGSRTCPSALADAPSTRPTRSATELKDAHAELAERFRADESVETLVHARAELIDAILREVWRSQLPARLRRAGRWSPSAATAAASCIRCSDVDILILVPAPPDAAGRGARRALRRLPVGHRPRGRPQRAHRRANAPRKAPPTSA